MQVIINISFKSFNDLTYYSVYYSEHVAANSHAPIKSKSKDSGQSQRTCE